MCERGRGGLELGEGELWGLFGLFPQHLMVEHFQLSDGRGVWLRAERITLDWFPPALLARRVQVDTLHAAEVDMERLPESSPNAHGGAVSIPRIDVASMSGGLLKLGAVLAGTP